jgi:hypothetical protein
VGGDSLVRLFIRLFLHSLQPNGDSMNQPHAPFVPPSATVQREFDAIAKLTEAWARVQYTQPTAAQYSTTRDRYNVAVMEVIEAFKDNGRMSTPVMPPAPPSAGLVPGTVGYIIQLVLDELEGATTNWPPMNSAHEGFGVLYEEFDELWEHVKTKQKNRDLVKMRDEAVDVAAMAIRFAVDICNEKRGRK